MPTDRYSHGHQESVLRSHRWRTAENSAGFLLEHLSPSMALLDVGCGPGTITADVAMRLSGGSAVGVDLAESVVEAARAAHADVANLSFEVGDAYDLSFEDGAFDVVYAHQVLQHLSEPVRALEEMRRVLRPGGLLAVRDADYGAFAWFPGEPALERWRDLYHELTRANGAEADAGRRLKAWVRLAGFADLAVSSSTWTYATDEERLWWGGLWADRVRESEFAHQCLEDALSNEAELAAIAGAFERWAGDPDGVFVVVHGEVLARA
jgi:ubiquinone/menaquinone biosynthesis C-methylase UbiE